MKAADLNNNKELNLYEILSTVAVDTASGYPEGFVIEQISDWTSGDSQEWKTLILPGEAFYEINYVSFPSGSDSASLNGLKIDSGKQKNINAASASGQWTIATEFVRDPIYDNLEQAGALNILNVISADSSKVVKQFPENFAVTCTQNENGFSAEWHIENEEELTEKVSKDAMLAKAGNTLGKGFTEQISFSKDGILESAVYADSWNSDPSREVRVTIRPIDEAFDRDRLNAFFEEEHQEGEEADLSWLVF